MYPVRTKLAEMRVTVGQGKHESRADACMRCFEWELVLLPDFGAALQDFLNDFGLVITDKYNLSVCSKSIRPLFNQDTTDGFY